MRSISKTGSKGQTLFSKLKLVEKNISEKKSDPSDSLNLCIVLLFGIQMGRLQGAN